MIEPENAVRQANLLQDLHSRGMNGVTAKIAREVQVFFQQRHLNTLACQQQSQHHARRPSANDAAGGLFTCPHGIVLCLLKLVCLLHV